MSVTMKADLSGLNSFIDDLGDTIGEAVRPAAQAGSQVLYEAVMRNVDSIGVKSGRLRSAIYQVYSKDNSSDGKKAVYHISWNARKAPHGHLVENGHLQSFHVFMDKDGHWYTDKSRPLQTPRQVAAQPFIRPAMALFGAAADAARDELLSRIDEKLA